MTTENPLRLQVIRQHVSDAGHALEDDVLTVDVYRELGSAAHSGINPTDLTPPRVGTYSQEQIEQFRLLREAARKLPKGERRELTASVGHIARRIENINLVEGSSIPNNLGTLRTVAHADEAVQLRFQNVGSKRWARLADTFGSPQTNSRR